GCDHRRDQGKLPVAHLLSGGIEGRLARHPRHPGRRKAPGLRRHALPSAGHRAHPPHPRRVPLRARDQRRRRVGEEEPGRAEVSGGDHQSGREDRRRWNRVSGRSEVRGGGARGVVDGPGVGVVSPAAAEARLLARGAADRDHGSARRCRPIAGKQASRYPHPRRGLPAGQRPDITRSPLAGSTISPLMSKTLIGEIRQSAFVAEVVADRQTYYVLDGKKHYVLINFSAQRTGYLNLIDKRAVDYVQKRFGGQKNLTATALADRVTKRQFVRDRLDALRILYVLEALGQASRRRARPPARGFLFNLKKRRASA